MASGDTKTAALINVLENGGDINGIAGCCNTNLQNYIIDSIDSVADAKDAIQNKGGTVDYEAGLSSLAGEIATIPSGGSTDNWGFVTYVDSNNIEHTVEIQNEDEYLSLGNSSNVSITIGGDTFNLRDITKVDLGVYAGYAPDYFLYYCNKLTEITGVENLLVVGNFFLSNCSSLDCGLNFVKLIMCGSNFLGYCTSLNHQVSFPELHTISDSYFMRQCTAYAQTITFPATLTNINGNYILYRCNNLTSVVCNCAVKPTDSNSLSTSSIIAPMFVNGITLTGTYANEWKAALPDSDTSPYRKLIVGS